jgi:hypothetical protein
MFRKEVHVRVMCLLILAAALAVLGGCYYEVRDAQTGRMFYSDRWIAADGYAGPLEFQDHTGRRVTLTHAEVRRLDRRDYQEITAPPGAAPATPPALRESP